MNAEEVLSMNYRTGESVAAFLQMHSPGSLTGNPPDVFISADDIVVIFQPDGLSGAAVVCRNGQAIKVQERPGEVMAQLAGEVLRG